MTQDTPRYAEPATLRVLLDEGLLSGSSERYEKRLAELDGLYRDAEAFRAATVADPDALAYFVESSVVERGEGALTIGISTLLPGLFGDEFAMTRGHIHERAEQAELYYGLSGQGVMLLETTDGQTRALDIEPGVAVHVPGHWVHRSVNVGDEPLSTLFCYATNAGQDYQLIADAGGMRKLVVADGGGWAMRDNPDHRGYARKAEQA